MRRFLKKQINEHAILRCILSIIHNISNQIQMFFGNLKTDSGTTHSHFSVADSLSYIKMVMEDYKKYAKISHFHGNVCELGPGDNSGIALMMLADGAAKVDLADRFYSHRNVDNHAQIYSALANEDKRIAAILKLSNLKDESTFPGVKRYYGPSAAGETFFEKRISSYDFIISRSVLEHTTNPLLTLELMYQALKLGGTLIHKVDLRDHGMFTPYHHDLKFLEISNPIYWMMAHHSGLPNRILINQYRDCASRLSQDHQLLITQLAYAGSVEPHVPFDQIPQEQLHLALNSLSKHREKFASSFQKLSENDLIVAGFFLILHKPKAGKN